MPTKDQLFDVTHMKPHSYEGVGMKHPPLGVRMRRSEGSESSLRRIAQRAGSCCPSPRRSRGVLAEPENFDDSLCPKYRGMLVGMTEAQGGLRLSQIQRGWPSSTC